MEARETIVMSVGGSLIVPDAIDTTFLSSLKSLIEHETSVNGRRFIIITGGGKTARRYADAAKAVSDLDNEDLDWLGIHATRLNGHLLRTIFKKTAHPVMITNPDDVLDAPKMRRSLLRQDTALVHRPICAQCKSRNVSVHRRSSISPTQITYTRTIPTPILMQ